MDSRRKQDLWTIAIENYQAADLTAQHGWHNVSAACSYYAVFTAMWIALGDPTKTRWEHGGIVKHFAPGQWRNPPMPIERSQTKAIRMLYNNRLKADYEGIRLGVPESAECLETAKQVLQLVSDALSFLQGGMTP